MNDFKYILVPPGDDNCPADALMLDFRKSVYQKSPTVNYPKNIAISDSTIKYWKDHADYYEESSDNIIFMWHEIPKENLPPLVIKLFKKSNKWRLLYLKEFGEDHLLIKGKQRKGSNKYGSIVLEKEGRKR